MESKEQKLKKFKTITTLRKCNGELWKNNIEGDKKGNAKNEYNFV